MQIQIHQREPTGPRDEILPVVRLGAKTSCHRAIDRPALGLAEEPLIRDDKESTSTTGRIADREVRVDAWIGLHAANDGLDQHARCEVLTCTLLAFTGGLFEQPLIRRSLDVDA